MLPSDGAIASIWKEPKQSSTSKIDWRYGLGGLAGVACKVAGPMEQREVVRLRMRE
jgi:hypothetical protein